MRCIPQAFFRSPVLFALVPVYASISMDIKTHANLEDLEGRPNTFATLKTQADLSINTWNKMQPSKEQNKTKQNKQKSIASSTQNVTREDQK